MKAVESPGKVELDNGISRGQATGRAIVLAGAAAIIIISIFPFYPIRGGPEHCGMKVVFGLPCPACGLTRSFTSMGALRPGEAAGYHLFGPPLYLATLAAIPYLAWSVIARLTSRRLEAALFNLRTGIALGAVLIAYNLVRMGIFISSGQFAARNSLLRSALTGIGLM